MKGSHLLEKCIIVIVHWMPLWVRPIIQSLGGCHATYLAHKAGHIHTCWRLAWGVPVTAGRSNCRIATLLLLANAGLMLMVQMWGAGIGFKLNNVSLNSKRLSPAGASHGSLPAMAVLVWHPSLGGPDPTSSQ